MAETQKWRIDTGGFVREVMVRCVARERWRCPDGHHEMTPMAAARAWAYRNCVMGAILAPSEPTRAELAAQLAAVTAERDALAALRPRDPHRTGHRCACCGREGAPGADDVCPWCSDGMATQRERDVARAQQTPLVACVDALRSAARDAGWRDADASGEALVAWVRRGGAREGAVVVRDAGLTVDAQTWGSR